MFSLSPVSDAAALGRAHAVVRRGRDIADGADLEACGGQRADGGLTTGTRALDEDVDLAHAVLHGTTRGGLGSHLRGERGGLARALEADLAGGGPGNHGTRGVGDRDDRVVERALDVSVPVGNGLLLAGHGALRALAGARVGLGALTAHRQTAAVPQTLVAADLDLAADVGGHLTAKVTLDLDVAVDVVTELDQLLVTEVANAGVGVDTGGLECLLRAGATHAENVGKCDLDALLAREVDTNKTCHLVWFS